MMIHASLNLWRPCVLPVAVERVNPGESLSHVILFVGILKIGKACSR